MKMHQIFCSATLLTLASTLSAAPVQWSSGFEETPEGKLPSQWTKCWGKPASSDLISVSGEKALSGKKSFSFLCGKEKSIFAYGFNFPEISADRMELSVPMLMMRTPKSRFHMELFTKSVSNQSRMCSWEFVGNTLRVIRGDKLLANFGTLPENHWFRVVSVFPAVKGKENSAIFRVDRREANGSWTLGEEKRAPFAPPTEAYAHFRCIGYPDSPIGIFLDDISVRSLPDTLVPNSSAAQTVKDASSGIPAVWALDFENQVPGEAPKNWFVAWGNAEKDRFSISGVKALSGKNSMCIERAADSGKMYGYATRFKDIPSGWGVLTVPFFIDGTGQNTKFMFQVFSSPFSNKSLVLHLESAFLELYAGTGSARKKIGLPAAGKWQRIVCFLPTVGGGQKQAGIRLDRFEDGVWKTGQTTVIPMTPPPGAYGDFRFIPYPDCKNVRFYFDSLEFRAFPLKPAPF